MVIWSRTGNWCTRIRPRFGRTVSQAGTVRSWWVSRAITNGSVFIESAVLAPIRQPDGTIAFIVDFTGADMKKLPADTPVAAQASTGDNAEIVENTVRYNPVTKGWRMILRLKVKDPKKTTEMRAALVNGDDTLSETWSYQLPANE